MVVLQTHNFFKFVFCVQMFYTAYQIFILKKKMSIKRTKCFQYDPLCRYVKNIHVHLEFVVVFFFALINDRLSSDVNQHFKCKTDNIVI